MDLVMGWPGESTGKPEYLACAGFDADKMTHNAHSCITGNGMHLTMLGCWQLYVKSNTLRRAQVESFVPCPISAAPVDSLGGPVHKAR
eukprot:7239157-Pyramimonas_sp.AAC.1